MSGVGICPNIDRHTPSPVGYVDRLTWMGRMHSAGAIQTRCPDCGLWIVGDLDEPRARPDGRNI